jgi:hypothetical protein
MSKSNIKKVASIILTAAIVMGLMFSVSAQSTVTINSLIADEANWKGDPSAKFAFSNNSLTVSGGDLVTVGYYGKKFKDEMIELNFKSNNGISWPSIFLRADKPDQIPWTAGGNGYLFVLKSDFIEIQSWKNGANKILATGGAIEADKEYLIQVGAVDTNNGVKLQIMLDGKMVAEYLDEANTVPNSGYFGLIAPDNSITVSGITSNAVAVANPKTSDSSLVPYLLFALFGVIAIFFLRKNKLRTN